MSPEQILGEIVDGRSDLYSLGCILYEMLTGERAFLDASGEISLRQRLTQPPPQPRRVKHGLSGHLNSLVTTAMARDPEQRFQSAAEVRDALIAAKNAPSAVSWRNRLPWRRAPKPTLTTAIPSPLPATPQERPGEASPTAPGAGETRLAAPQPSLQRRTVVRPRSAVAPTRRPAWLVVGFALTALLAFGVWRLLSPTTDRSAETATADSQIVLPATEAPPREAVPDMTPAPVATPAKDSARTGTFRFAGRLPADATLEVDGARVTLSQDGSLSLAPGRHLLRVDAPGYQPIERSIDIAAGKTEVSKARLLPIKRAAEASPDVPTPKPAEAPATGTIVLTGDLPESAEVNLDGVTQPTGAREISADAGSHWLQLSAPGFQPESSQVEVTGGETSHWEVPALTAIPPVITVEMATPDTTIPVGAIVQLGARAKDDRGTELADSVVWESSNGDIVAIDRRGRATGRTPGSSLHSGERSRSGGQQPGYGDRTTQAQTGSCRDSRPWPRGFSARPGEARRASHSFRSKHSGGSDRVCRRAELRVTDSAPWGRLQAERPLRTAQMCGRFWRLLRGADQTWPPRRRRSVLRQRLLRWAWMRESISPGATTWG